MRRQLGLEIECEEWQWQIAVQLSVSQSWHDVTMAAVRVLPSGQVGLPMVTSSMWTSDEVVQKGCISETDEVMCDVCYCGTVEEHRMDVCLFGWLVGLVAWFQLLVVSSAANEFVQQQNMNYVCIRSAGSF